MIENKIDIELIKDKQESIWISVGYRNAHIVFLLCIAVKELIQFFEKNINTSSFNSLEIGCFGDMKVSLNVFPDDKYQIFIDGPEIVKQEYMSFSMYFDKSTYKDFISGMSRIRCVEE